MKADKKQSSAILESRLKQKLYSRLPDYIFSNDLFENWIKESLHNDSVWIDAGCGKNTLVTEFEGISSHGIGIDAVIHPELNPDRNKFIQSKLDKIPLPDSYADTIIMNMVVEHIRNIEQVFKELHRILKTGGNLIFRTTNKHYPTQLLGHLLPKKIKDKIIYKIFGVESHDIFGTFYKINTVNKIKRTLPELGFNIYRLQAVEDLHVFNSVVFELSYIFYKLQRMNFFYRFRNCIVCWAKKSN
jgi:SAM-dependent methyltransferase